MSTLVAAQAEGTLIHVLWLYAGFNRDGDSVSLTASTQPSIEEIAFGARRDLVAQSLPASGWLRLDHQTLAVLTAYKVARGLTTADEAADDLLDLAGEMAR